jgi:hypothetical protein
VGSDGGRQLPRRASQESAGLSATPSSGQLSMKKAIEESMKKMESPHGN